MTADEISELIETRFPRIFYEKKLAVDIHRTQPIAHREALVSLGETFITFLAYLALGEYKDRGRRDENVERTFFQLFGTALSLGQWLRILRECTAANLDSILRSVVDGKAAAPKASLFVAVADDLHKHFLESPVLADPAAKLAEIAKRTPGKAGGLKFFDAFVRLRNCFRHDEPFSDGSSPKWPVMDLDLFRALNPLLEDALLEAMAQAAFLQDYQLGYFAQIDQDNALFRHQVCLELGSREKVRTVEDSRPLGDPGKQVRYLFQQDKPYIRLPHPKVEPAPEFRQRFELERLAKFKPKPQSLSEAQLALVRSLVAQFLANDGVLDDAEMQILVAMAAQFNVEPAEMDRAVRELVIAAGPAPSAPQAAQAVVPHLAPAVDWHEAVAEFIKSVLQSLPAKPLPFAPTEISTAEDMTLYGPDWYVAWWSVDARTRFAVFVGQPLDQTVQVEWGLFPEDGSEGDLPVLQALFEKEGLNELSLHDRTYRWFEQGHPGHGTLDRVALTQLDESFAKTIADSLVQYMAAIMPVLAKRVPVVEGVEPLDTAHWAADLAVPFLRKLKTKLAAATLPFQSQGEPTDEQISEWQMLWWYAAPKHYYGVWFDWKRGNKVALGLGYYSDNKKNDPAFRAMTEAILQAPELGGDGEHIFIEGTPYGFTREAYLGLEVVQRIELTRLELDAFVDEIAGRLLACMQNTWPLFQAMYAQPKIAEYKQGYVEQIAAAIPDAVFSFYPQRGELREIKFEVKHWQKAGFEPTFMFHQIPGKPPAVRLLLWGDTFKADKARYTALAEKINAALPPDASRLDPSFSQHEGWPFWRKVFVEPTWPASAVAKGGSLQAQVDDAVAKALAAYNLLERALK